MSRSSKSQLADPALQNLLAFLASRQPEPGESIAHPDHSVNALMCDDSLILRQASVLIPVIRPVDDADARVVLTVRSKTLSRHAGQVSLPGGTREPGDKDAVATALREAEEEIGLKPSEVEVVGTLEDILIPTGFRVTPVVGLVRPGLTYIPCPIEVADIFEAPLSLLLDQRSYLPATMIMKNLPRRILELRYTKYRIWGATAAILHHLAREVDSFSRQ
ncbi:MAG: CoA pyrophosphatase [Pseudohongiellaceae bacterium]